MTDTPREGGVLALVATPIGNLEDITLRALRVLREANVVLAEDTRRTRSLLRAHNIENQVERLDDHVVHHKVASLVARLQQGDFMALVSDAGSPLVSDPGALLVRAVTEAGVRVESIPGPSAAIAALSVSGLAGAGFRFVGFLPRDGAERQRAIAGIARDPLPTVLFESPSRTAETIADLAAACGAERRGAIARELTKLHEEVLRDGLETLAARARTMTLLGEVTIVVAGAEAAAEDQGVDAVDQALDAAIAAGMRPSDAAREVARALGLRRADVYERAVARAGKR